jgi:serine/threonine protein kinase
MAEQPLGVQPDPLRPFLAPAGTPDLLGYFQHYEVRNVLGQGASSIVLEASDTTLRRTVALKILAPHLADQPTARHRFLREARAAASIFHDHVVGVYAVGEQPLPYLVMEFVAGETLQAYLDRNGPLPADAVARLGRQIASGLAAAHENGLIHRDIKPANVLLGSAPGLPRNADSTDKKNQKS